MNNPPWTFILWAANSAAFLEAKFTNATLEVGTKVIDLIEGALVSGNDIFNSSSFVLWGKAEQ